MVWVQGVHPDHEMLVIIQPLAGSVASRYLQPFLPPQALDLFVVDGPTLNTQECGNLAKAITALLPGQPNVGELSASSSPAFRLEHNVECWGVDKYLAGTAPTAA